ncbi:MAG: hypothetical protein HKO57_17285, partial [Akkermansiaceae bacterium]|nr:hypothetical protein [Akkermansiaceae bacterium]
MPVYSLRPWLEAVVGTVFLLAAIRMHQAAPHGSSRLMGLGFGCLVVAKLYEGALQLGMIKMNYFPGYDHGWIGSP